MTGGSTNRANLIPNGTTRGAVVFGCLALSLIIGGCGSPNRTNSVTTGVLATGRVSGRVEIANTTTPNRYEVVYHKLGTYGPPLVARLDRNGRFVVTLTVGRYVFEGLMPIGAGTCDRASNVVVSAQTVAHPTYSCTLLHR